jgi:peptidoglycan hydrolase-like protein with peptidoglycan-binding domain
VKRTLAACILLALLAVAPASAAEMGSPRTAALQIALAHKGLYHGTIDGHWGDSTEAAVRRLQRNARIGVDGVPGPQTRKALGKRGRHRFGSRMLVAGNVGWDVSQTQFLLAWHGFPSGAMDGHFSARTTAALQRFQVHAHLAADGVAGPAVFAALRAPLPRIRIRLSAPVGGSWTDGFGPRGNRFHTGLDFPAGLGARVHAAASGRVTQVGWDPAGYGNYVVIRNSRAAYTWYAHLSRVGVSVGQRVRRGQRIGRVGASGSATGPHLHFELRIRRAAVDPSRAL